MKIRIYFVIVSAILLGGCAATLDDFREMNAHQRADYACNHHHRIVLLDVDIEAKQSAVVETEAALRQGYRIHRHCEEQLVTIPSYIKNEKSECSTDAEGVETCTTTYNREDSEVEYRTICSEIPVAIDGAFEKEKLQEYRSALQSQKKEVANLYDSCYRKVKPLGADQAFDYYQSIK